MFFDAVWLSSHILHHDHERPSLDSAPTPHARRVSTHTSVSMPSITSSPCLHRDLHSAFSMTTSDHHRDKLNNTTEETTSITKRPETSLGTFPATRIIRQRCLIGWRVLTIATPATPALSSSKHARSYLHNGNTTNRISVPQQQHQSHPSISTSLQHSHLHSFFFSCVTSFQGHG